MPNSRAMKRRNTKDEAGNFRAGYVHIDEEHLHKTGIRGRKVYIVFALIIALTLIAVVNILITFTILGTVRLGYKGMEAIEFVPGGRLMRFLARSYFNDSGLLVPGEILSLPDREITITGSKGNTVHVRVTASNTTFVLGPYKTRLHTDEFEVIDPDSGQTVFTTDFTQFKFPKNISSIILHETETERVASAVGEDLLLKSNLEVTLRGVEGTEINSREISITARNDLVFNAAAGHAQTEGHMSLSGTEGPFLPLIVDAANTSDGNNFLSEEASHKVCVCMPSGQLFAVPSTRRCDQANETRNPCL